MTHRSLRHWALLCALGLVVCLSSAFAQFRPPCDIPYERIATRGLDIESCPAEGETEKATYKAQNIAKNNLCATGRPIPLTHSALKRLQKAVDDKKAAGDIARGLPGDRSVLANIATYNRKKIGEGTVVQYVGFVHKPRYSPKSGGESVNCKRARNEHKDIHVDVVRTKGEPACRSITVEVIPHFRPELWEVENLRLIEHPVRFTGHLFYDASHTPCKGDNDRVSPKRASNWEIHPVYAIDVCRSKQLSRCSARNKNMWIPLDSWLNSGDYDEEDED